MRDKKTRFPMRTILKCTHMQNPVTEIPRIFATFVIFARFGLLQFYYIFQISIFGGALSTVKKLYVKKKI